MARPASRGGRGLGEMLDAPIALVVLLTLAATMSLFPLGAAGSPAAADSRPSLPAIERQVMCVTCKIPLAVAQSPQADRERAFIQILIDRGENEAQVKRTLVSQYGPAVLALPSAHGFDLAAYLVPLAAVLALLAALAVLLPRWRRQTSGPDGPDTPPQALSPGDAARLDADLTRFD